MQLKDKHFKLLNMLTMRRPSGTPTEQEFVNSYIATIPGIQCDVYGNHYVDILHTDGERANTMFTAHTDSVHNQDGIQNITVDPVLNMVYVDDKDSNCLGADDATGIYIMLNMIEAGVPGLYAFFRDEEVGGLGSNHAYLHETWWHGAQKCISFDRTSYTHSVITEQWTGMTASDTFAQWTADMLRSHTNIQYVPDPTGIFTDSAHFADAIEECTNISVGYYDEHSKKERQDLNILDQLIDAVIAIVWDAAPISRTAGDAGIPHWDINTNGISNNPYDDLDYTITDDKFKIDVHLNKFMRAHGKSDCYNEVLYTIDGIIKASGLTSAQLEEWWAMEQLMGQV
jgi:hypothetical protein